MRLRHFMCVNVHAERYKQLSVISAEKFTVEFFFQLSLSRFENCGYWCCDKDEFLKFNKIGECLRILRAQVMNSQLTVWDETVETTASGVGYPVV